MKVSADYSSIEAISQRLIEASNALSEMVEGVAKARHVREYDSDRRKRALSSSVTDFLKAGDSAAAAEHNARASTAYAEAMKGLARDLTAAEQTVAEWESVKIRWETARSLLSVQKSLVTNL